MKNFKENRSEGTVTFTDVLDFFWFPKPPQRLPSFPPGHLLILASPLPYPQAELGSDAARLLLLGPVFLAPQ